MNDTILLLLLIGGAVLALYLYLKFFKLLKVKNVIFIDGSLGTGKTFLTVALAVRLYKRNLRIYQFKRLLFGALARLSPKFRTMYVSLEEPLLYSNIRLRHVKFVKITKDLIMRKNFRFAYKSVLLLDEFSLVADQYIFKDREVCERLSLFFKLFRHETRGGFCVLNSQQISDLPYPVKYVLSDYLYIHHRQSYGLFSVLRVQEMVYSADRDGASVVNSNLSDIEDSLKCLFVFNKYFHYYDSYCYSIFTDCLPVEFHTLFLGKNATLKDKELLSFKSYRFLEENINASK